MEGDVQCVGAIDFAFVTLKILSLSLDVVFRGILFLFCCVVLFMTTLFSHILHT